MNSIFVQLQLYQKVEYIVQSSWRVSGKQENFLFNCSEKTKYFVTEFFSRNLNFKEKVLNINTYQLLEGWQQEWE